MRFWVLTLSTMLALLGFGTWPSEAQYAAQLYPYCAMSSSSGATSCYYRSRASFASGRPRRSHVSTRASASASISASS